MEVVSDLERKVQTWPAFSPPRVFAGCIFRSFCVGNLADPTQWSQWMRGQNWTPKSVSVTLLIGPDRIYLLMCSSTSNTARVIFPSPIWATRTKTAVTLCTPRCVKWLMVDGTCRAAKFMQSNKPRDFPLWLQGFSSRESQTESPPPVLCWRAQETSLLRDQHKKSLRNITEGRPDPCSNRVPFRCWRSQQIWVVVLELFLKGGDAFRT